MGLDWIGLDLVIVTTYPNLVLLAPSKRIEMSLTADAQMLRFPVPKSQSHPTAGGVEVQPSEVKPCF